MTKSALGTEKQRKINKKLLSRCMESGRGSCIEETDWEANKPNVSIFGKHGVYMPCIYTYRAISVAVEKTEITLSAS